MNRTLSKHSARGAQYAALLFILLTGMVVAVEAVCGTIIGNADSGPGSIETLSDLYENLKGAPDVGAHFSRKVIDTRKKVHLVIFWAPTPPIRACMHSLQANPGRHPAAFEAGVRRLVHDFNLINNWQKAYGPQGLQITAVVPNNNREELTALLAQHGWHWPLLSVEDFPLGIYTTASEQYRPAYLLFDRPGRLACKHIGLFRNDSFRSETFLVHWALTTCLTEAQMVPAVGLEDFICAQMYFTRKFDFERHADAYMKLFHRALWEKSHENEFEMPRYRKKIIREMKEKAAGFDPNREFFSYLHIDLGKYDLLSRSFPLEWGSAHYHFSHSENTRVPTPFPYSFTVEFSPATFSDIGLTGLPMPPEKAEALVKQRTNENGHVDRSIHCILRYRMQAITDPEETYFVSFVPGITSAIFYPGAIDLAPVYAHTSVALSSVPLVAVAPEEPVAMPASERAPSDNAPRFLTTENPGGGLLRKIPAASAVAPAAPDFLADSENLCDGNAADHADALYADGAFNAVLGERPEKWHWWASWAACAASDFSFFQACFKETCRHARKSGFRGRLPAPTRNLWLRFRIVARYRPDLFLWANEREKLGHVYRPATMETLCDGIHVEGQFQHLAKDTWD